GAGSPHRAVSSTSSGLTALSSSHPYRTALTERLSLPIPASPPAGFRPRIETELELGVRRAIPATAGERRGIPQLRQIDPEDPGQLAGPEWAPAGAIAQRYAVHTTNAVAVLAAACCHRNH